ncbi:MAG: 1-acyl-sn-glycerol-3-phosphate acyltransferase [Armatimonadetes bacterium]|nr:1-acyl-sn-glycerol-3-phosphate acyltransferase [Armatimonadota bacterium]
MAKEIDLPVPRGHWAIELLRYLVVFPLLTLLGPLRFRGWNRVPRKGGLIILCNHLADCDPVVLQAACPRGIQFMSKSELWDMKVVGPMMKWWGAFPVKRGEPDRASLRIAAELAKGGAAVGIFPEGQLSEDGLLQEIKPGAALIIRMAGVPVICCGLRNTNRILPYGKLVPRPAFAWVSANWGEVREFSKESTTEEIVAWAESEFRRLIPEPKSG